jgi:glycosyltransferase involved in cell wall biosynthesis
MTPPDTQDERAGTAPPARVLLVHNYYQLPGGEDRVFEAEGRILEANGHAVERLTVHNDDLGEVSKVALARQTVWSRQGRRRVYEAARDHQAEVVHFHNTLPQISPAGYYGARDAGAAVVQTLHNYRMICPGALLHRDHATCEACVGKAFAWPGVVHGCYRGSRGATLAVAAMTATHRALGTWTRKVDRFIAITEFARKQFVHGGVPPDLIEVKANPLSRDPGIGTATGGFALYVGRLGQGKGVHAMLDAWDQCAALPELIVVGDGPESASVVQAHERHGDRVRWVGWQDTAQVLDLMRQARVLIFPSELYEGGTPMSIVEAFACGLPVVASDLGAARELVRDGVTGARFSPGDPQALAAGVHDVLRDEHAYADMRANARRFFEVTFAPAPNYAVLNRIYQHAIQHRHAAARG